MQRCRAYLPEHADSCRLVCVSMHQEACSSSKAYESKAHGPVTLRVCACDSFNAVFVCSVCAHASPSQLDGMGTPNCGLMYYRKPAAAGPATWTLAETLMRYARWRDNSSAYWELGGGGEQVPACLHQGLQL